MPGIRKGLKDRWLPPLEPRCPSLEPRWPPMTPLELVETVEVVMAAMLWLLTPELDDGHFTSDPVLFSFLLSEGEELSTGGGAEPRGEGQSGTADSDGAAAAFAAVVEVVTTATEEEEEAEEESGGGVCGIMVPTLNMVCCGRRAPCGWGMPWSIMGSMLMPLFLPSSDPPDPPGDTAKP